MTHSEKSHICRMKAWPYSLQYSQNRRHHVNRNGSCSCVVFGNVVRGVHVSVLMVLSTASEQPLRTEILSERGDRRQFRGDSGSKFFVLATDQRPANPREAPGHSSSKKQKFFVQQNHAQMFNTQRYACRFLMRRRVSTASRDSAVLQLQHSHKARDDYFFQAGAVLEACTTVKVR